MNFHAFLLIVFTTSMQKIQAEINETEQERLRSLPGHMKPYGSTGLQFEVHAIDGFPTTTEFFNGYVAASLPLLMKNAAKISPAFQKWTNEYLLEKAAGGEKMVMVERGKKKAIQTGNAYETTFREFVETYDKQDVYLVNEVSGDLLKDVVLPPPLQCDEIFEYPHTNVLGMYMLMSSGGTKSAVHKDDVDNINCLYRGNKTFLLVSPFDTDEQWMVNVIDQVTSGYSSLDVDAVDFVKYPSLSMMRYGVVHMKAGDCIYIPWRWVHQVNSFGDNLAVSLLFRHKPLDFIDLTPERCGQHSDVTLDQVAFDESFDDEEDPDVSLKWSSLLSDVKYKKIHDYDTLKIYILEVGIGKPKPAWNKKCEKIVENCFKLLNHDEDGKLEMRDFHLLKENKGFSGALKEVDTLVENLALYIQYAEMERDRELIPLVVERGDVIPAYAEIVYGNYFERIMSMQGRDEL